MSALFAPEEAGNIESITPKIPPGSMDWLVFVFRAPQNPWKNQGLAV